MTAIRVLHPADYRRERWKNDGGRTTELARHPDHTADNGQPFDWRISIADIETDGAFSEFPGYQRRIALLDGIGMLLQVDDDKPVELRDRLRFVEFAGESKTSGCLLSGPVRDFNVIWRRELISAEVLHRPLVGPMVFFADAQVTWFAYLASGTAQIKNRDNINELQTGDSLLLLPDADCASVVLTGGGELVLVKFSANADR